MNDVYEHYYSAYFAEKGHELTREQAEIHANRYEWNYSRWLRRVPRGTRVLDLGCGTGEFLYYLRKEGFQHMIGVDLSNEQLHEAQRFFATQGGEGAQPMWEQSGAEDFLENQREGRFGMVAMNDLIEHVHPDAGLNLLKLVRRALAPESPLFMKVPNMDNPFAASLRWRDLTHRAGYTESSLRHLLLAAGFDRVQIVGESAPRHTLKQKIRHKVFNRIAKWFIRLGYFAFEMSPAPQILEKNLLVRAYKPAQSSSSANNIKPAIKGTDATMALEELEPPKEKKEDKVKSKAKGMRKSPGGAIFHTTPDAPVIEHSDGEPVSAQATPGTQASPDLAPDSSTSHEMSDEGSASSDEEIVKKATSDESEDDRPINPEHEDFIPTEKSEAPDPDKRLPFRPEDT